MPRFSLRALLVVISLIAMILTIMRSLENEWRLAFAVACVAATGAWVCLWKAHLAPRMAQWYLSAIICLVSAWYLWLGLHPSMYYLTGFAMIIFLWMGVILTAQLVMAFTAHSQTNLPPRSVSMLRLTIVVIPLVTTLLLAFQVPLRLGAATAIPRLEAHLQNGPVAASPSQRFGIYRIKLPGQQRGKTNEAVYFRMADDGESALVYSPTGSDDIRFNEGSKGHLFGDWYWIKED